jgi:hypothetical protein
MQGTVVSRQQQEQDHGVLHNMVKAHVEQETQVEVETHMEQASHVE